MCAIPLRNKRASPVAVLHQIGVCDEADSNLAGVKTSAWSKTQSDEWLGFQRFNLTPSRHGRVDYGIGTERGAGHRATAAARESDPLSGRERKEGRLEAPCSGRACLGAGAEMRIHPGGFGHAHTHAPRPSPVRMNGPARAGYCVEPPHGYGKTAPVIPKTSG